MSQQLIDCIDCSIHYAALFQLIFITKMQKEILSKIDECAMQIINPFLTILFL